MREFQPKGRSMETTPFTSPSLERHLADMEIDRRVVDRHPGAVKGRIDGADRSKRRGSAIRHDATDAAGDKRTTDDAGDGWTRASRRETAPAPSRPDMAAPGP